ncbi:hypothetical protein ACH5RR_016984, partial [Cinchona calisaya]
SLLAFSTAEEEGFKLGSVIGINLGTTYSCAGVLEDGLFTIITNDQGNDTTPSWVGFTDGGEILIGETAENQATINPERTIFHFKRLIGRKFEDDEVQRQMKRVPYKIVNKDGKPNIEVKFREGEIKVFSPEEIGAMVITKLKESAEAYLGKTIKDAVLTVPAYFNDAQRQGIKDAGIIAGLNVASILDEPKAAAIGYGWGEKGVKKIILVFHLGGGTFDVNILTTDDGASFHIFATNGDNLLGGNDFDQRVMEYFIELIKKKYGKDISENAIALEKLRRECEYAKRALSSQHEVHVEIKRLFDEVDFSELLTRSHFEMLNNDLFIKIMGHVEKAIDDAGLDKHEIDEIVLVGGSTMIPKVHQLLKDYFDGKEFKNKRRRLSPDEVAAFGATIYGGILNGEVDDHEVKDYFVHYPVVNNHKSRLSEEEIEEIERMIREFEEFDEQDKIISERLEAKNNLEAYIYNIRNQMHDKDKLADKLELDEKEKMGTAIKEALEWLDSDGNKIVEKEVYEEKLREVEAICNPIVIAVYQR